MAEKKSLSRVIVEMKVLFQCATLVSKMAMFMIEEKEAVQAARKLHEKLILAGYENFENEPLDDV